MFYAAFLVVQLELSASVTTQNCSAKEHTPALSSYHTEIQVKCDRSEIKLLGSVPVWKDRNTLSFKKFVRGNFAIAAELTIPEMRILELPGELQPLVPLETREIFPLDALEITDEFIASDSGASIPLNLIKLKNIRANNGYIFYVHGGSASPGGMAPRGIDFALSPVAKQLLKSAYTIVNLSYRGDSILSEGDYLKLGYYQDRHPNDYYRGEISDFLAAERYILQKNPKAKIFYHGISHGAQLVNLLAGKYAPQTKAVAFFSDSGIWDIPLASNDPNGKEKMSWYLQPGNPTPQVTWNDYGKQWPISNSELTNELDAKAELNRRLEAGDTNFVIHYSPAKPSFIDRNPSKYLDRIQKPLLIRHGRNDISVSFNQHTKLKQDLALNPNPNLQLLPSRGAHGMMASDVEDIQVYLDFIKNNSF